MRLSLYGDVAFAARPLVRVRTREDGHEATLSPWPIYATTFAIHRRYARYADASISMRLREAFLPARADMQVLREVASRLRHRRRLMFGPSIAPLRDSAGPVSRLVLPALMRVDALLGEHLS